MRKLLGDIRYGMRALLRDPGFAVVVVLTLALGMGATTAVFSVADAVLLRPLSFPDSDRIMTLWNVYSEEPDKKEPISPPDFCDWREQSSSFAFLAAYEQYFYILTSKADPVRLHAARVSGDFFAAMGVNAILGRPLLPSDDHEGRHGGVVLSYRLWRNQFGSNPSIVGQAITLNGRSYVVTGIMPAGFEFPDNVDLWSSLAFSPQNYELSDRRSTWLRTVARLKPGVTPAQAQTDMSAIAYRLEQQYPGTNAGRGIRIVSLYEQTVGGCRLNLLVSLGAVGCVLLITCSNVTNLLLVRATGRQQEVAVRTALGADRLRLAGQLVTESILVCLLGGAGAILLAAWVLDIMRGLSSESIPRLQEVRLNVRMLGFSLLVSLVTGVAVGIAPAVFATRQDFHKWIKGRGASTETAGGRRVRRILVIVEIALAQVLLVGGGLLLQSFLRLRSVDPGFNPHGLMFSRFELFSERYAGKAARTSFYQQAVERVTALPSVRAAALSTTIPLHDVQLSNEFVIEGRSRPSTSQYYSAGYNAITPGYFRAMHIRLLAGRYFSDADRDDSMKVSIINEALARRFWPGRSPIGSRIRFIADESYPDPPEIEIVGVVGNVRQVTLDSQERLEIYLPYAQRSWQYGFLIVRSSADPEGLAAAIRREIRGIDPDISLSSIRSMKDQISASVDPQRFRTLLLGTFAALSLVLSAVGIFGVISHSVLQRTREFGIRLALGAQPRDIFTLAVGSGFQMILMGVVSGLALSLVLTRFLSSLLFGIAANDASTYACVTTMLCVVALAACCIPSCRAMRADPIVSLRSN
jgi:putative ABC transport system permease protein